MNLTNRIGYLDAVRGLAAFSVMAYHLTDVYFRHHPKRLMSNFLFNGSDAVSLFFVLSGVVLSLKYFQNGAKMDAAFYKKFIIGRIFRLYPAFWVVLLIGYVWLWRGGDLHTRDVIWNGIVHNHHNFWEEATLIRGIFPTLGQAWTLGIEVIFSIFVPLLIIIFRYDKKLIPILGGVLILAGSAFVADYLVSFLFGVWIAGHFEQIRDFRDTSRWWYRFRWAFFPLIWALYCVRHVFHWLPPTGGFAYFLQFFRLTEFLLTGLASGLILMYCINSQTVQRVLTNRLFLWLGKISYGVYLIHWILISYFVRHYDKIKILFRTDDNGMHTWGIVLFVVPLTFLSAELLYRWVEIPFIRWGRRLASAP